MASWRSWGRLSPSWRSTWSTPAGLLTSPWPRRTRMSIQCGPTLTCRSWWPCSWSRTSSGTSWSSWWRGCSTWQPGVCCYGAVESGQCRFGSEFNLANKVIQVKLMSNCNYPLRWGGRVSKIQRAVWVFIHLSVSPTTCFALKAGN